MRVVVLGAGLMGAQIGVEYALGGHRVTCVARRREGAEARVDAAFDLARTAGLADEATVAAARTRLDVADRFDHDGEEVDLVLESVPEDLALKGEVLRDAAERSPTATLATNTSSLSVTAIGEAAGAPARTLGTHYWNPPLLMPLVEVIAGERTAPDRVARATDTLRALGKRPVAVAHDVPGFVWNRLQAALLREAIWLVEHGIATPAAVDEVVRDGLARRWRLTGPFETAALGGADTFARLAANLFPVLSDANDAGDLRRWLDHAPDDLAATRRRRDAELIEELRRDRAKSPAVGG